MGYYVEDEIRVGRFSLDCYVRETHLGYEADGRRYHQGVAKRAKDAARDAWIEKHAGIPVLRVPERLLKPVNDADLTDLLVTWTLRHAGTAEERRCVAEDNLGGV